MTDTPISMNDMPEFVGQIIECFEDFLEERHIHIPNPERAAAMQAGEDPDSVAIIYGSDYGELQSYIEEVLFLWGLTRRE